jgi:cell division protein FtsB
MTDQNRKIMLATAVTALLAVLWLIFSPWGAISYFHLKRELVEARNRNLELTETNSRMQVEIARLKTDSTYLEKVARDQYGLLRKNEIVFQTPPPKKVEKH